MNAKDRFEANVALAYHIAFKWSRRNHLDLDDCRQVALIALWRACETYDERHGAAFGTYAGIVIERRLMRAADLQTRHQASIDAAAEICNDEAPDTDIDLDEAELVKKAMASLTERERYVVDCKFVKGQTQREIGAALGITHQAVFWIYEKALEKMRRRLGVNGGE